MAATTNVNGRTVVHKDSGGITNTFPDVCKTPTPGGPVPVPYPNISKSADTAKGSKTVKVDGNPVMLEGSNFSTSTGDEAGSAGGVVSSTTKGKAEFVNYSIDVKIDGKPVCRQFDPMLSNKASAPNTPPGPECQAPLAAAPMAELEAEALHTLICRFAYKQPEAVSGNETLPRFKSRYCLSGAEERVGDDDPTPYSVVLEPDVKEGKYGLEFIAFDLKEQPLKARP